MAGIGGDIQTIQSLFAYDKSSFFYTSVVSLFRIIIICIALLFFVCYSWYCPGYVVLALAGRLRTKQITLRAFMPCWIIELGRYLPFETKWMQDRVWRLPLSTINLPIPVRSNTGRELNEFYRRYLDSLKAFDTTVHE